MEAAIVEYNVVGDWLHWEVKWQLIVDYFDTRWSVTLSSWRDGGAHFLYTSFSLTFRAQVGAHVQASITGTGMDTGRSIVIIGKGRGRVRG